MIGMIWTFVKGSRLAQAGIALLIVLLLVALYTWKVRSDAQADFDRKAQAQIELADKADAAADALADQQRAPDAAASAKLKKELTDAYAKTPDQAPDAVRLVLACKRLCFTPTARTAEFSAHCGPSACK